MNYIIFALPRSRTTWLANFLTHGNQVCLHEPLASVNSLSEVNGYAHGFADTSACLNWRRVIAQWPEAKRVVVERPLESVQASLKRKGAHSPLLEHAATCLSELPADLRIPYDSLNARLPELWALVRGDDFPEHRFNWLRDVKVEPDLTSLLGKTDSARLRRVLDL